MPRVCVLGGGVSGLAAAYYLKQLKPQPSTQVVVVEGAKRLGGWVQSQLQPTGALFEIGPRTLRTAGKSGANSIALAEALGLEQHIRPVISTHPASSTRLIRVGGKLHTLPNNLFATLFKTPPFSKPLIFSLLREIFVSAPQRVGGSLDESIHSFISRRFGPEAVEYLVDPMLRGVYAGSVKELSMRAIIRPLYDLEQQHGGVVRGLVWQWWKNKYGKKDGQDNNMTKDRADQTDELQEEDVENNSLVKTAHKEGWAVWSLDGGIETLVRTLEDNVKQKGVKINLNSKVEEILFKDDGVNIKCGSNTVVTDHVISCLPAKDLALIVGNISPNLKSILQSIPYVSLGIVSLEYNTSDLLDRMAFGYLTPSSESSKVLGVIFDTCAFPQQNKTILTVMMGGYWFKSLFGENPSKQFLLETALEEVGNSLQITTQPSHHKVSILRDCIPQYIVGHCEVVARAREVIEEEELPLSLAGSAYDGVGVNDSVLSARTAVNKLVNTM